MFSPFFNFRFGMAGFSPTQLIKTVSFSLDSFLWHIYQATNSPWCITATLHPKSQIPKNK